MHYLSNKPLAKSFDIPWMLTCDNDLAGNGYVQSAKSLCDRQPANRIRPLPEGFTDLEQFLYMAFSEQYLAILGTEARNKSPRANEWILAKTDTMQLQLLASGDYQVQQNEVRFHLASPEFQEKATEIVAKHLATNKVYYSQLLVEYLHLHDSSANVVPAYYKNVIDDITKTAGIA